MDFDLSELIDSLNNALTPCQSDIVDCEVNLTYFAFGSQIVQHLIEAKKIPAEFGEKESKLFSMMFISAAMVFGTTLGDVDKLLIPQTVSSSTALTIYYDLLAGQIDDVGVSIGKMNETLSNFFTKKAKGDQLIATIDDVVAYLTFAMRICALSDMETVNLPKFFNISKTGDKITEFAELIQKLLNLCDSCREAYIVNPSSVSQFQDQYLSLYDQIKDKFAVFSELYRNFAEAIRYNFQPLYEEETYIKFQDYLKVIVNCVINIVFYATKMAEYDLASYQTFYNVLAEYVKRLYTAISLSTSMLRFRGDFKGEVEKTKAAVNDLKVMTEPIKKQVEGMVSKMSEPYKTIYTGRLVANFQTLGQFLGQFDDIFNYIVATVQSDRRFPLFQSIHANLEGEITRKALPLIKSTLLIALTLSKEGSDVSVAVENIQQLPNLCTQFITDLNKSIVEEKDEKKRQNLFSQRAIIESGYSSFVADVNLWIQSQTNPLVVTKTSLSAFNFVISLCTLDNDHIIVEALEEIRNVFASKGGLFFSEQESMINQLIQIVTTQYANDKLVMNAAKICTDLISECKLKMPSNVNPQDPDSVILSIQQNFILCSVMKALAGTLPSDTPEQKSVLTIFDMLATCFSMFSKGYCVALQLNFTHESEILVRSIQPFDSIASIGTGTIQKQRQIVNNLLRAVLALIDMRPPYGVFDKRFLATLTIAIQKLAGESVSLLRSIEPLFQKSNDIESIKVSMKQLEQALRLLTAMFPYINAVFQDVDIEVPAINGIFLPKEIEKIRKLIKECTSKLDNGEAFNSTEIVDELFEFATHIDTIPQLSHFSESICANAAVVSNKSVCFALGDATAAGDIRVAFANIIDILDQIEGISHELAEAVKSSNGDIVATNKAAESLNINANKMPTLRPASLDSLNPDEISKIQGALGLEPAKAIKAIKQSGVDVRRIPLELGAKDASAAIILSEQAPLHVDKDGKENDKITGDQAKFLDSRAGISDTPEFTDTVAASVLKVLRDSDISNKTAQKFQPLQADFIYRSLAESVNSALSSQQKQSLVSDSLCIITSDALEKLNFNPEQVKIILDFLANHVSPLTDEENKANQLKVSELINNCQCTPEQKNFLVCAIQAMDSHAIRNRLANITEKELASYAIKPEHYSLIRRYLNKTQGEPVPLDDAKLLPQQIQALEQRLAMAKNAENIAIKNLTAALKYISMFDPKNLVQHGISQDQISDVDSIVNDCVNAIANEQEKIASDAAFELAAAGLDYTNLHKSTAIALVKNATPTTLVQARSAPSVAKQSLPIMDAGLSTPSIGGGDAGDNNSENSLVLDKAPTKEEIDNYKPIAFEGPTACGFVEHLIDQLEDDSSKFAPLVAEVQKSPENRELVKRANFVGQKIKFSHESLDAIKGIDEAEFKRLSTVNLLTLPPFELRKAATVQAVKASTTAAESGYDDYTLDLFNEELVRAITTLTTDLSSVHIIKIAAEADHNDPGLVALDNIEKFRKAVLSKNVDEIVEIAPVIIAGAKISTILEGQRAGEFSIANELMSIVTKVKNQKTVNEEDKESFNKIMNSIEDMVEENVAGPSDVSDEVVPDKLLDLTSLAMANTNVLITNVRSKKPAGDTIKTVKSSAIDLATTALIAASKRIGSSTSFEGITADVSNLMKSIQDLEHSMSNGARAITRANRDLTLSLNKLAESCDDIVQTPQAKQLECDKFEQVATQMLKDVSRIARLSSSKNVKLAQRTFKRVSASFNTSFGELKATVAKSSKVKNNKEIGSFIDCIEAAFTKLSEPQQFSMDTTAEFFTSICNIKEKIDQVNMGDTKPHPELVSKMPYRFTPRAADKRLNATDSIQDVNDALSNFLTSVESVSGEELLKELDKFHASLSQLYGNARVNEIVNVGDQAIIIVKAKLLGETTWRAQSKQLRKQTEEAIELAKKAKTPDNPAHLPLEEALSTLEETTEQLRMLQQQASQKKATIGAYLGYDLVFTVTPIVATIKAIVEKAAVQNKTLKADFDDVIKQCNQICKDSSLLVNIVRDAVEGKKVVIKDAADPAISMGTCVQNLSAVYKKNGGIIELTNVMTSLSNNVKKTAEGIASIKEVEVKEAAAPAQKPIFPTASFGSSAPRRNNLLEKLNAEAKVVEARRKLQNAQKALEVFSGK